MASEKFTERLGERAVAHDIRVMGDFVQIWCDGHHAPRSRCAVRTDAAERGVYRKPPVLCAECIEHLAYAEKRRAYCPKDPKPFCINCDSHCYSPAEQEWQRTMMRFSGPRSWYRGHAMDGIRHLIEVRKYKRRAARDGGTAADTAPGDTAKETT